MRTRRILATAATGLTAATLTLGIPAAASASSGGGCGSSNGIEACISFRAAYGSAPGQYRHQVLTGHRGLEYQDTVPV